MFRHLRTRAAARKAIDLARSEEGVRNSYSSDQILDIDLISPTELSSRKLSEIYEDRDVREAAMMQLIEVGSFWLHHAQHSEDPQFKEQASSNYKIAAAAASLLGTYDRSTSYEPAIAEIRKRYEEAVRLERRPIAHI